MMVSHLMQKIEELPEKELIGIKEQFLEEFHLMMPFYLELHCSWKPHSQIPPLDKKECLFFDEVYSALRIVFSNFLSQAMDPFLDDKVLFFKACGCQSDQKMSESTNSVDVLSDQLIESVLEIAQQVASILVFYSHSTL